MPTDRAMSLHGRTFRATSEVSGGEVGPRTLFEFTQEGDLVSARYSGGQVRLGFLVGTITGDCLRFRYAQVNQAGETATGHSHDRLEILPDGRIRLLETWAWDSAAGEGTSVLEEIYPAI